MAIGIFFQFQNCLHQMFKISSLCSNTRLQTLSPLTDSSVNNTLLQTTPDVNQLLHEFIDIVDLRLIDTLLYDSQIL